jgi:DNA-binding IclR family transcriptional regulator
VAQLLTPKFIPVLTPVGMRVPMYCTSSGRAWLSCLDEAQARALLEAAPRPARTAATLTAVDDILAKVAEAAALAWPPTARSCSWATWASAPRWWTAAQPVAAVHIAPPTSRWTLDEAQRKLGPMVIECARAISQAMAH